MKGKTLRSSLWKVGKIYQPFFAINYVTLTKNQVLPSNRLGCGVNPKASQHTSSKANAVRSDLSIMAGKICKREANIHNKNQQLHKSVMNIGKFPGYVQSNDITSGSFCVVLFDEGSIRLYRHVCLKDAIFLDATGVIVENVRSV